MKKYEILLILPGTLDETEAAGKIADAKAILEEMAEGVVLQEMGKNRLAYPIKHIRYGYFYLANFFAEEEQIQKIQDKLALSRELLRAMITLADKETSVEQKITYFGEGRFKRGVQESPEKDKRTTGSEEKAVVEDVKEPEVKSDEAESAEKSSTEDVKEDVKPVEEVSKPKETPEEAPKKESEEKKGAVDLKEIDKKLDEILSDDNIMSGV